MSVNSNPATVEIKVTVSDSEVDAAAKAFRLRSDDAKPREIWFCESRAGLAAGELRLLNRGIILRLRKISGDPDDVTLKLRGTVLPPLPPDFGFELQGDWSGSQRLESASIVTQQSAAQIEKAVADGGDLRTVLSQTQINYLKNECVPAVDPMELKPLGPVTASKWSSFRISRFPNKLRAEQWEVKDLRFLEFSIEVGWAEAEAAQEALHLRLGEDIKISMDQAPKTTLVLRRLARLSDD